MEGSVFSYDVKPEKKGKRRVTNTLTRPDSSHLVLL
jgi:hypothetical protein